MKNIDGTIAWNLVTRKVLELSAGLNGGSELQLPLSD